MHDPVSELIVLNEGLRAGTLFDHHPGRNCSEDFFRCLRHFGLVPEEVMVLAICPDGDDTVIGSFVTKDGKRYAFDFDLADMSESRLTVEAQHTTGRSTESTRDTRFLKIVSEAAARWFGDR